MDAAAQKHSTESTPETAASPRGGVLAVTVALTGILLTGIVAGGIPGGGAPQPASPNGTAEIATVAPADLIAAMPSLSPITAAALISDAKSCRTPLAYMTLSKAAGTTGGAVRIRSGVYLSPLFQVTDAPQRIALPFPAPYTAGHGQIAVEGVAPGLLLTLTPGWSAPNTQGAGIINLFWHTDKPCGT